MAKVAMLIVMSIREAVFIWLSTNTDDKPVLKLIWIPYDLCYYEQLT